MHPLEIKVLQSALADLGGDIQAQLTNPQTLGKVQIARFLLAHLMARHAERDEYGSIEEEVAAFQQTAQEEQRLLGAAPPAPEGTAAITAEMLTPYLRVKLNDPGITVTHLQASLGGFSKQTFLITLSGAPQFDNRLVMRRDQVGGPVEVQTADEFDIVHLMHQRGIAAPQPLWADRRPPFSGTCMVMRMVPGKTVYDVTGTQMGREGKGAALGLARVLGQIHSTPMAALKLPAELARATLGEHVRRMVSSYEAQWKRRRPASSPTLEAAFAWLLSHVPEQGAPVLVHGDASLRNLMVHDGRESALLDWELWHVGDPNEDLAYSRTDVEQFVGWDEFMQCYQQHGGCAFDPVSARYYGLFGAVRNAVFTDNCLHSFLHAPTPEPKLAYGALAMGRKLIPVISEQLKALG